MRLIKAPNPIPSFKKSIFLAGSIEMGKAFNWQNEVIESFENTDVLFLNPRRDDWDSTWVQKIENKQFLEQVEWELNALENCSIIVMYFDPKTQSPISLLELGLFAKTHKMIVCCPEGFWRKGNVDIVCKKYFVEQVNTLEELIDAIRNEL